MEECDIPGDHPFVYEIDSQGIYQVYKSEDTGEARFFIFPGKQPD